MSSNRQNTQRGRGGRGGRGGGRGGKRRKYKKWKPEPVKKKPFERCPFIVGSPEWAVWKNKRYENNVFHSTHEYEDEFIPRTPIMDYKQQLNDKKILRLQKKMIDNNWTLKTDDDEYFEHPRYMDKKVEVYYYIASNGREFKIPFMDKEEDYEGLACSIAYTCPNFYSSIEPNEFTNYYDTRYGRRRRNYNDYLEYRMERRYEFEEEEKSIAVANALNKKLTNNATSNV